MIHRTSPTIARSALGSQVESSVVVERQRALRALLCEPLITAVGSRSTEFVLIRRHARALREWLHREPEWRLQVEVEFARLHKIPADLDDGTRAARDANGTPFTRRRYVLLCLALAVLERSDRQTTLGRMAEAIENLHAADPGFAAHGVEFELETLSSRRDLVAVIRFLMARRVLAKVQGEEEQFIRERGDVLYDVERPILATLLSVRRGPSTVESEDLESRLTALTDEPRPETDDGRNRSIRSRLVRRLLENPVVYYDDLDEAERNYLLGQRPRLLRTIEDATGLIAEVRAEGIALVDERGEVTDLKMPEQGTDGHHALLVAEFLADRQREHDPESTSSCRVSITALEAFTAELIATHRAHWRRDVGEPGAERRLTRQTVDRLAALSLLRFAPDGAVEPLSPIARYALAATDVENESLDQPELFS